MSRAYEDSSLWRSAFGARSKDKHADQRKSLELAYKQFREAVLPLLRQVAIDLPALTIHDETHVDQLWDVASEICGADYPLNPLEGFVLGGSFLLHDSALSLAAYENSLSGLMQTADWQDAVARLWRANGVDQPTDDQRQQPPDDIKNAAIFNVLRNKHSKQAEILIDRAWKHPTHGAPIVLLENAQLQEDYGKLVGRIAASHHWPIKQVDDSFPAIIPASANWPREWEIDPLKLACILRCADAAAIDERRAPSRLFAFRPTTGTSGRHWAFQNKLYPASLQQETLIFVSKTPFDANYMEDWWLCFDAVNIIDEELKASNASLAAHNRPPFEARQAFGAQAVLDLQTKITVLGWTPVDTRLRVSDIPNLIKRLGGTKLYGESVEALFRELIQNGADAIRARRRRDLSFGKHSKYPGKVVLRLNVIDEGHTIEVSVQDDGIGMPVQVLTGALLDFGTSFWNTELAASLYPGLQSDTRFRPAGKYGIGFFSAFMFSDQVAVTSRPYSGGSDDTLALIFENGLNGRAQLKPHSDATKVQGDRFSASTEVKTRIPTQKLKVGVSSRRWMFNLEENEDNLDTILEHTRSFLAKLCFPLDVSVLLETPDGQQHALNAPSYYDGTSQDFLERINRLLPKELINIPLKLSKLIEPLKNEDGRHCGRCCISIDRTPAAGLEAIDGFIRDTPPYNPSGFYEGIVEYLPAVASRDYGTPLATDYAWNKWAENQLSNIVANANDFSKSELYFASSNLAYFDVELSSIAHCCMLDKLVTLNELLKILKREKRVAFLVRDASIYRGESKGTYKLVEASSLREEIGEGMGSLIDPIAFVQSYARQSLYEDIGSDFNDVERGSVLSYFLRILKVNDVSYDISFQPDLVIGKYSGYSTHRISDGDAITSSAIVVDIVPSKEKRSRKKK